MGLKDLLIEGWWEAMTAVIIDGQMHHIGPLVFQADTREEAEMKAQNELGPDAVVEEFFEDEPPELYDNQRVHLMIADLINEAVVRGIFIGNGPYSKQLQALITLVGGGEFWSVISSYVYGLIRSIYYLENSEEGYIQFQETKRKLLQKFAKFMVREKVEEIGRYINHDIDPTSAVGYWGTYDEMRALEIKYGRPFWWED